MSGLEKIIYILRSSFYLLTPNETYYEKVEEVPPLIDQAGEILLIVLILENIIFFIKNGTLAIRFNDGITSLFAGITSRMHGLFFRSVEIVTYVWVHENFKLYVLPWNSLVTYIVAFITYDFLYYWFHRMAHEVNLLWSLHQMHHNSQYYHLASSLRQSVILYYFSWVFYLPAAFFIPPSVILIHSYMNLSFQFWLHTTAINSLGFFEYIFNTPSHHRVHHGRNPYCIDKNYGGVLIIWDRIFGTFEAERPDEKIAYGLVENVNTFEPFHLQFYAFVQIFKRASETPGLMNKIKVICYGPGWVPNVPGLPRTGDPSEIPEVEKPIFVYDPEIRNLTKLYIVFHVMFIVLVFSAVSKEKKNLTNFNMAILCVLFFFGFHTISLLLENKPKAIELETLRCFAWIIYDYFYRDVLSEYILIYNYIFYLNHISLVLLLLTYLNEILTKKLKKVKSY